MNLFRRSFLPFFVTAIAFGVFLAGCLDIPDDPNELQPVISITVMVKQQKSDYSALLKINPADSATLKANVLPEDLQNDLTYEWFFSNEETDSLLKRDIFYSFYPNKNENNIPNKLIVTDGDGNQKELNFNVIINTPPVLADSTIPVNGDTLYGSVNSAFFFEWFSFDRDLANGDSLFHILEIDETAYDVGTLSQVKQSGFNAGEHKFRIIVQDLYGDTDTLAYKKFYVVDTLEAK